jgi:hypothetical protein
VTLVTSRGMCAALAPAVNNILYVIFRNGMRITRGKENFEELLYIAFAFSGPLLWSEGILVTQCAGTHHCINPASTLARCRFDERDCNVSRIVPLNQLEPSC